MQYILVNGLPYLAPASYLPALLQQQYYSLGIYGAAPLVSPDGTYFSYIPAAFPGAPSAAAAASATFATTTPAQGAPAQGDAAAGAAGQEINPQDQAARDQRRAASLWLIMKLAFGIYLFSQNGSIERIILLHIAALVIFLHQTGRLRIVRRIVQQPAADGAQAGVNPVPRPGGGAPGHVAHNQPSNANNGASGSASSSSASNAEAATVHDSDSTTIPTGPSTESSYTTEGGVHGEGVETNPVPRQQVSTWRSIEHALLTFVTSLVPAPPPEIDPAVANAAAGA
ncbi:hypothetical protein BGW38_007948 [Lunasporangiospora selenospora]|uniref:Uncharacterized protein n=1 Tax=Lunasporangiospora selenospora TaxID=979761 RepID=A0A9P6K9Y5_9FUNG|nr:hypothetical protein BGW38_007948 [Lunasporangiospora selenospora]